MKSIVRHRVRGLVLATGAVLVLGACGGASYASAADAEAALEKGGVCTNSQEIEGADLPAGVSAGVICGPAGQEQAVVVMLFEEGSGQEVFQRGLVAEAKGDPESTVVTGGNWMAVVEGPGLADSVASALGGSIEA